MRLAICYFCSLFHYSNRSARLFFPCASLALLSGRAVRIFASSVCFVNGLLLSSRVKHDITSLKPGSFLAASPDIFLHFAGWSPS